MRIHVLLVALTVSGCATRSLQPRQSSAAQAHGIQFESVAATWSNGTVRLNMIVHLQGAGAEREYLALRLLRLKGKSGHVFAPEMPRVTVDTTQQGGIAAVSDTVDVYFKGVPESEIETLTLMLADEPLIEFVAR